MKSLDEFGSVVAMAALILGACAAFGADAATPPGNSAVPDAEDRLKAPQAFAQAITSSWSER